MAKKKPPKRKPDKGKAQQLQDFYDLGRKILAEEEEEPHVYGEATLRRLAKREGVTANFAYKARKFAEVYTEKDFEALCKLRRPDGAALSTTVVTLLVGVQDKRDRKELERRAASEGWTSKRVEWEVSSRSGNQRSGRHPKRAKTTEEALIDIAQRSGQWDRWAESLDPGEAKDEDAITSKDLPLSVRKRLAAATRAIDDLLKAAKRELKLTPRKKK